MIYRSITSAINKAIATFPALVLTGPRQSGKTTLFKSLFAASHRYLNLETPPMRQRAREDPLGLLNEYPSPLIIDEIQYVPELLTYLKERIDQDRRPNQYLLTGSQNFALMQGVSQSLAGRAAVFNLLPLSLAEVLNSSKTGAIPATILDESLDNQKEPPPSPLLEEIILRGSYPEVIANPNVDRELWCGSYLTTYLERDVRNLEKIGDLDDFERFLRLCAVRTGQILNLSELARDVGISVTTAKRWLSVLEASYQIFLLHPYYRNLGKRLIKSPKIYFCDTGLASYLMGLNQRETLTQHPGFAQLFETLVVTDFLKRFLNAGQTPPLYYFRTQDDLEVDLVVEQEQKVYLYEIKSSATIYPKHTQNLRRASNYFKDRPVKLSIISNTAENFGLPQGVTNYSWRSLINN